MEYPLESLGPERFQRVCQALLAKEFPAARLLPVGQPDGGRDAFIARWVGRNRDRKELVVFQVKYARDPAALDNPRRWVIDALNGELPKIKELKDRGAVHYRLITNVRGSAHLDSGSIDRLDSSLFGGVPIPADAWWRDDLNTRLDSAWDLKWAFPELLTGPDLLRAVIENGLNEEPQRRESAIRAFLADQYESDAKVKFKQVELQNELLDLFIDVPAQLAQTDSGRWKRNQSVFEVVALEDAAAQPDTSPESERGFLFEREALDWESGRYLVRDAPAVGGASLLLHDLVQEQLPFVVLEGAPGQGKSTLAQYVCQVHRMRLLDLTEPLERIPEPHRRGSVRLPFRIDLRDLALWLTGGNPFPDDLGEISVGRRSLETFLAAQVESTSGGASFSV